MLSKQMLIRSPLQRDLDALYYCSLTPFDSTLTAANLHAPPELVYPSLTTPSPPSMRPSKRYLHTGTLLPAESPFVVRPPPPRSCSYPPRTYCSQRLCAYYGAIDSAHRLHCYRRLKGFSHCGSQFFGPIQVACLVSYRFGSWLTVLSLGLTAAALLVQVAQTAFSARLAGQRAFLAICDLRELPYWPTVVAGFLSHPSCQLDSRLV